MYSRHDPRRARALPLSHHSLASVGRHRSLDSVCEDSQCLAPVPAGQRFDDKRAPWQSDAVAVLASEVQQNTGASDASTMVMQGPQGTIIQAIGSKEDHAVAGRVVAHLQHKKLKNGEVTRRPPTPPMDRPHTDALQSKVRGPHDEWSFGAVYEHRDAFGKPRLVGSTAKLPERQFLVDKMQGVPCDMTQAVVWAGVSKLPPSDMTMVRREVASERARRLDLDKLGSIKPYSHHGY
eukprot:GEMP01067255.1.p1 GENE.GEMP01067255.1~~GEMP01067255.1.p1  ORF type:complete len:236 (+),score=65.53 GEMP01067255.1:94-801(+)